MALVFARKGDTVLHLIQVRMDQVKVGDRVPHFVPMTGEWETRTVMKISKRFGLHAVCDQGAAFGAQPWDIIEILDR